VFDRLMNKSFYQLLMPKHNLKKNSYKNKSKETKLNTNFHLKMLQLNVVNEYFFQWVSIEYLK
jgi:hypothetical protein